ncbi:MAG: HPP family protein [Candidatus Latescibacteria bacterium]|nr:HPP family protein [Candidatus Latescibacterota bacterium]
MQRVKQWIGIELDEVSAKEKLISALGGLVAICLLAALSHQTLQFGGSGLLVASMGASAVLLFAVPHGPLSQPWPVLAGHGLSALIGILCARYIPNPALAAGCAVGLAIGVMHQCKCIHPPGGATALTAVIGGPGVTSLGFSFLWMPVLLNALVIVLVAVAFNYAFKWRRYPAAFTRRPTPRPGEVRISHEAVTAALRSLDSFVDISEDDLIRLADLLAKSPQAWHETASPGDHI